MIELGFDTGCFTSLMNNEKMSRLCLEDQPLGLCQAASMVWEASGTQECFFLLVKYCDGCLNVSPAKGGDFM